ncbi:Tetratricopeptide repeat protein 28 [Exaiptasia diaphana]|nr:Tetratricopeptide repeat protein 28 [Exaiptasia diaphana]
MSLSYKKQGKYHDVIRLLEESLEISVKIGRKEKQAGDLLNLGSIYTTLNDYDKAIEMFQKSLAISIEIGNKRLQANCYGSQGNVLFHYCEKYSEAIVYYQKCLDISKEIDNKQSQSVTLLNIGKCLNELHRYEEAKKQYDISLAIAKELNDKYSEASIYHAMAIDNICRNQIQTALTLLEKCLDIASTIGNTELEGAACCSLGKIYYSLHKENQGHQACHVTDDNIAKSEEYLRRTLDCFDFIFHHLHQRDQFKISKFDTFIATYKFLAILLIETKRTQEALLVSDGGRARALGDRLIFKYGLNVALRINDSRLTAQSYEGLGRAYHCLCNYQNSLKCYEKAIDLFKQLNNEEGLGVCYANQSVSYIMQGKYNDAIRLLEENLRISVKIGSKEKQASDLLNLGTIYTTLDDIDKALEMFLKSLAISIEITNKCLQAKCYGSSILNVRSTPGGSWRIADRTN